MRDAPTMYVYSPTTACIQEKQMGIVLVYSVQTKKRTIMLVGQSLVSCDNLAHSGTHR